MTEVETKNLSTFETLAFSESRSIKLKKKNFNLSF